MCSPAMSEVAGEERGGGGGGGGGGDFVVGLYREDQFMDPLHRTSTNCSTAISVY